jgi:hypothetical protein
MFKDEKTAIENQKMKESDYMASDAKCPAIQKIGVIEDDLSNETFSTHSIIVNGSVIGADLASTHQKVGCFVLSVHSEVSAIKCGDILAAIITKNAVIMLENLSLQEIQVQIMTVPRPFTLSLQRHDGMGSVQPFQLLQCAVRGPDFLQFYRDNEGNMDKIDLFLSLHHLTTVNSELLENSEVIKELLQHELVKGANLQEVYETIKAELVNCMNEYAKTKSGSTRLAYWRKKTYSTLPLSVVLSSSVLLKALFFFAENNGLRGVLGGCRFNCADHDPSPKEILLLANILPNPIDLDPYQQHTAQTSKHISSHSLPFDTASSIEIQEDAHLIVTDREYSTAWIKTNTTNVKTGHRDISLSQMDITIIQSKIIDFAKDLIDLSISITATQQNRKKFYLISFRHGETHGTVYATDKNNLQLITSNIPCYMSMRNYFIEINSIDIHSENINKNEKQLINDKEININAVTKLNDNKLNANKLNADKLNDNYSELSKNQFNSFDADKLNQINCELILEIFTAKTLNVLILALITECKIVFISNKSFSTHALIIEYLINLMKPFNWKHIVQTIIPKVELIDFLMMPFPFICGIPFIFTNELNQLNLDELVTFNLDNGSLQVPKSFLGIISASKELSTSLECCFRTISYDIDTLDLNPNSTIVDIRASISEICHSWIMKKIDHTKSCVTKIGSEIFFDEKAFTDPSKNSSEKKFMLALARTQHFSVYLTEDLCLE